MGKRPIHLCESRVKRAEGQSTLRLCPYDMRQRQTDKDGHRYNSTASGKKDYVSSGMILPDNCPQQYDSPIDLWVEMEALDKRWDSCPARRLNFALPNEFDDKRAEDVAKKVLADMYPGFPLTFAIHRAHNHKQENLHVHALVGWRQWGYDEKQKKEKWLNKTRYGIGEMSMDMHRKREVFASEINRQLELLSIMDGEPRVQYTHLSYKDAFEAGLISAPRTPSRHYGPRASAKYKAEQQQIVVEGDTLERICDGILLDLQAKEAEGRELQEKLKRAKENEVLEVPEAPKIKEPEVQKKKPRVKKKRTPEAPKFDDGSAMWEGLMLEIEYIHPEELDLRREQMELLVVDNEWTLINDSGSVRLPQYMWADVIEGAEVVEYDEPELPAPPELVQGIPDIGREIEEPDGPDEEYNYGRGGR